MSTDAIGQALASGLIATALFKTLVEKGVLTPEEGSAVIKRAIAAVRHSVTDEERAALRVLEGLDRQLHT